MKYRAIIRDAWVLTQENKNLIWYFALLPALLSTVVTIIYLTYQFFSFWNSPYFRESSGESPHIIRTLFEELMGLFTWSPGLGVFLLVVFVILILAYLMLPVFTEGAIIQLTAKLRGNQPINMLEGVGFGLNRFLQLFEYHLLIKTFSLVGVLTEATFVLRNLGPEAFGFFGWIFVLILIITLILGLMFTYSEYYIVIDNKGVFASMMSSSGLVVRQWQHTLFMLFLMALISVRVIINLLVALVIPILILAPIALFASFTLTKLGIFFGILLGLIALFFTSYFIGIFNVFANAVWTFTFLELSSQGDLDLRAIAEGREE